jgi:hypothetical protein
MTERRFIARACRKTVTRALSLVLVVASTLIGARSLHAQEISRFEAAIRVSQARAAIRRGDEQEAIRLLRESIALHATPEALREIATIYERRGDRRLAAEALLRLAGLARSPRERADAAEHAELLRRAPSLLRVWVLPADASRRARVWFDRDPPRPVPVGGAEATVEGGTHRVRVESPGYQPFEVMVTTAFGETLEVVARMQHVSAGDAGARD